jgi:HK97 family phage major capsid protein
MATENAKANADQKSLVAEIRGQLGDIRKGIANLNQPVYPHADGRGFNQWLGEEDTPVVVKRGVNRAYQPIVPVDYKPYQIWKGLSGGRGPGAFSAFLREGLREHRTEAFVQKYRKAAGPLQDANLLKALGMSEGIGGDGGFAVLPEYSTNIFEKLYENDLFNRTDNYTVVGNSMTFPRLNETSRATGSRAGGLEAYWTSEAGSITSSKPALGELSLKLKKLAIVVYLTDELIDDAGIALEQYVTRKVTQEFNFMIGDSIVEGTGGGQPQGFLNSGALLVVAKQTGQAASTIVKENLDSIYARMWAGSIPSSVWLMNQDCWPSIFGLNQAVGTGGYPMFIPPGGYSAAPNGTLLGRPIVPIEFASTVGTQGDISLVDLNQYVTIGKGGIAQAQSIHVAFLTDELALRFVFRVDGAAWENSPVTPFKGSNTQSSFVTLATRS